MNTISATIQMDFRSSVLAVTRQGLGYAMRAMMLATVALGLMVPGLLVSAAQADDVVQVTWRKAQIMSFGGGVSGIVIGDPSVVDVTVEGNGQIVVFGKAPGETNLIVTGSDNSVLYNASVVVMPENNDRQVSIISAGAETISERSWTCLERCVQVIGPGGTKYASVKAAGGSAGAQIDAMLQKGTEASEAMSKAAQGVGQSAGDAGKAVGGIGGAIPPTGGIVAPY